MTHERDTHFAGFAELLYQELSTLEGSHETLISEYRNKYDKQEIVHLIAQRAYDLAVHIVEKLDASPLVTLSDRIGYHETFVNEVPDMTEWPEKPKE